MDKLTVVFFIKVEIAMNSVLDCLPPTPWYLVFSLFSFIKYKVNYLNIGKIVVVENDLYSLHLLKGQLGRLLGHRSQNLLSKIIFPGKAKCGGYSWKKFFFGLKNAFPRPFYRMSQLQEKPSKRTSSTSKNDRLAAETVWTGMWFCEKLRRSRRRNFTYTIFFR